MSGAGIQFLSTVIIARTLGEGGSAGFFFWSSVLMTSGPIASYGLEQIALRNVPRLHRQGPEVVGRFLASLRCVSLSLSFLIGIGLIGYAIASEKPPGFHAWHLLLPVALASIAITLINGEALKGLARPVAGVVFGHLIPVSLFCLLTAIFSRHLSSPGLLTLYTASYLTAAIIVRFAPVPDFRERLLALPKWESVRTVLREGFSVCCVNVFGALAFILPLAYLEFTSPPAEVAYITTAFRISILFFVLSHAIHGVFAPALSTSADMPNPFRPVFRVYFKAIAITLAALILPLGFGIAFPEVVMSIFGNSFKNGADALRLLLILQLVTVCLGPVLQLLLMTGHTVLMARLGVLKIIFGVALSLILIPRFGGVGMVVALGVTSIAEEVFGLGYAVVMLKKSSLVVEPS